MLAFLTIMDITASINTLIYVAFVILGILLVGYLTYVLIRPERF
jgi:K+-transporting ATPase KdpF subunit